MSRNWTRACGMNLDLMVPRLSRSWCCRNNGARTAIANGRPEPIRTAVNYLQPEANVEDNGKSLQRSAKRWLYCFGVIMLLSFSLLGYRLVDLQVVRHARLVARPAATRCAPLFAGRARKHPRCSRKPSGDKSGPNYLCRSGIDRFVRSTTAAALAHIWNWNKLGLLPSWNPNYFRAVPVNAHQSLCVLQRKVPREKWRKFRQT